VSGQPRPLGWYFPDAGDPQAPADAAVVTPTLLRPHLVGALESIYGQQGVGRIQVLLGVDRGIGDPAPIQAAIDRRPAHVSVSVVSLPYSTSAQRGGVHPAVDGGSLRSMLSFMANSRHVAYLDDDNAWEPDHLASLLAAVQGRYWAHSMRLLVDEETGEELAVDRWDSTGVGSGRFASQGGMVDPNCLMIDKVLAGRPLGRWSEGPDWRADRTFFEGIKDLPHGMVPRATVRYRLKAKHVLRDFIRDGVEF
jgi:hypothetical protein